MREAVMSHHFSILWDSVHLVIWRKQGLRGHMHPVFMAALLIVARPGSHLNVRPQVNG